jgi:hypothetical protein
MFNLLMNIRIFIVSPIQGTFNYKQIHKWNMLMLLWLIDPLLGNDSVNTFPRQRTRRQQSDNFRCYTTRSKCDDGERVFSVWFTYIHCGTTDEFSMDPPRDYASGTEQNQVSRTMSQSESKNENENGASPRQSRNMGSAEDCLWVIETDCD